MKIRHFFAGLLLALSPLAHAADVAISALPAASTPLAGTEAVPMVQSGTTAQATVDSITNRAISPTSVTTGTATVARLLPATGTITASDPAISATQTWNNAAVGFTLLKGYATNTASASASYLLDLGLGSQYQFRVDKDGVIDIYSASSNEVIIKLRGTTVLSTNSTTAKLGSGNVLLQGGAGYIETGIARNAAGVVEINSGSLCSSAVANCRDLKVRNIVSSGTAPTVAGSCGTSPSITGGDLAMKVTTGTGSPTSCTVTFGTAKTNAPSCTANASSTTTPLNVASTTTTVTVSSATLAAGEVLHVHCITF